MWPPVLHCFPTIKPSPDALSTIHICSQSELWNSLRCLSYPFLGPRRPSLPYCLPTIKPSPVALSTFVHSPCSFKCILGCFVVRAFAPTPTLSVKEWVIFAEDKGLSIIYIIASQQSTLAWCILYSLHICSQSAAPCVVFPSFFFEILFCFYQLEAPPPSICIILYQHMPHFLCSLSSTLPQRIEDGWHHHQHGWTCWGSWNFVYPHFSLNICFDSIK